MSTKSDVTLSITATISDIISAAQLPGSSILQRAVEKALDKRKQEAVDALIAAIAAEGPNSIVFVDSDADELVQMLLRFWKAASEGAARENLRLLANVIIGLKRNSTLFFDQFQECANVLENLTRDEILIIGKLRIFFRNNPSARGVLEYIKTIDDVAQKNIVRMHVSALQRHGLFLPLSVFSDTEYMPTPIFDRICELASV
jgi:hypothetical protein